MLDVVSTWLLRVAGGSTNKLLLTTMSVVSGLSGFMNNTAVTSLFIGPTMSVARKLKTSPSKLLMPVCFASILGGTCTLIGTSTNVAVSGEIQRQHEAGLVEWIAQGGNDLNNDGELVIIDFKSTTKHQDLNTFDEVPFGAGLKIQLEWYNWLFLQKGFNVDNTAYLVYYNAVQDKHLQYHEDYSNYPHMLIYLNSLCGIAVSYTHLTLPTKA